MPHKKQRQGLRSGQWLRRLFAQPPAAFYGSTSVYLCGREMEIENYRAILDYSDGRLQLNAGSGRLTVTGYDMTIVSLEAKRILLHGTFLRAEFSYG